MLISSPTLLCYFLLGGSAFAISSLFCQQITRRRERRKLILRHDCQPPIKLSQRDPFFGLDTIWDSYCALKSKTYLDQVRHRYQQYGNTFSSHFWSSQVINTIEPDNIRTVLTTKFKDYGIGSRRKDAFAPLLGNSIVLSDGAQWEHSRAMLRPSFTRSQVGDLPMFEIHVHRLIQAIPKDGSTLDLAQLFYRLTADVISDFMFGKSIQSLVEPESLGTQFVKALHHAQAGGEKRWFFGGLAKIMPQETFYQSVKEVHGYINIHVDRALRYRECLHEEKEHGFAKNTENSGRYIFLRELSRITDDRQILRDELLSVFVAGRDTTAALLINLFFVLARRPDIWQRLRREVDTLMGEAPTIKELKNLAYVRYCIKESQRLHPEVPTNIRTAYKDTVLPTGGGPDGKSPIFVPAGTLIAFHITALHRRQDLWGEDAEEFRPERWATEKDPWKYLPFSGGPRSCPGQEFAFNEALYTVVRLVQSFERIEARDPEPWTEELALSCASANGVKVAMIPVPLNSGENLSRT